MKKILIIYYSQSGMVQEMANAVKRGIEEDGSFKAVFKTAEQANRDDLMSASGIAIGTPDYFDYMAGTVKDFFDRTFYSVQSKIRGSLTANMPCVFFVSGGTGGMPALESLKKISSSFRFKVVDHVASGPRLTEDVIEKCELLGKKLTEEIKKEKT